MADQPAQLAAGGGIREGGAESGRSRAGTDQFGAPTVQPAAFTVGDGVQEAQPDGRQEESEADEGGHGGDGQPREGEEREQGRTEPAREPFERDERGAAGPDDDVPDAGQGVRLRES